MDFLQVVILISSICVVSYLIYYGIKHSWPINDIANIATIYGVVLVLITIFKLSPQIVSIQEKPKLLLHSFRASEGVYWSKLIGGNLIEYNIPEVYINGYVSNIGTAIASNIAFEFKLLAADNNFKPCRCFRAYIFPDPKSTIPPISDLVWHGLVEGSDIIIIPLMEVRSWTRLELPPIPPDNSIGIAIGFSENYATELEREQLKHVVTDKVSIRIIKMGDSQPVWNPDRSSMENYKEKLITPDETQDSCGLTFFMSRPHYYKHTGRIY